MIKVFLFLYIVLLSCTNSKNVQSKIDTHSNMISDSSLYKIYRIDSLNSYYLVYAKRKDTFYKIVSKKEEIINSIKIKNGGEYELKLNSIWTKDIMVGGVNVSPSVTPNVTCLSFDDSTKICIERDSINDLHQAANLRGLYMVNK
jgi:hypothetical protein